MELQFTTYPFTARRGTSEAIFNTRLGILGPFYLGTEIALTASTFTQ